jgi:ATP-dependent Clp protease ATP-binding subunit ClpC
VTVRRLVNRGDLTAYRIGGEYRFMQADIDDFVKQQRVPAAENASKELFKHFTPRALKVMELAGNEAKRLEHNYIGTEHMLLGLISEHEGVAARVLSSFGIELEGVRNEIVSILKTGQRSSPVLSKIKAVMFQSEILLQGRQAALTGRAKRVIELAINEAKQMGHDSIGPEHLLLGIIREGDGLAIGVLEHLGVDPQQLRAKTLEMVKGSETAMQGPEVEAEKGKEPLHG